MIGVEMETFVSVHQDEFIFTMPDITLPDQIVPDVFTSDQKSSNSVKELINKPFALEIPLIRNTIEFDQPMENRKDPSFVILPDGKCMLLVSVNETSSQSGWKQFAYIADDIAAPVWNKMGEVKFNGVDPKFTDEFGEEIERTLCAAGVFPNGEGLVVQDLCFHNGGNIHLFEGEDPTDLEYAGIALKSDPEKGIAGIYDPEPITGLGPRGGVINRETGEEEFFMTVTTVGSYKVTREEETGRRLYFPQEGAIGLAKTQDDWIGEYKLLDRPLLTEKEVPGHIPTIEGGEWVMEGGKITELDPEAEQLNLIHQSRLENGSWGIDLISIKMEDLIGLMNKKEAGRRFLHYFTAFIDGPNGSRQRGFLASSDNLIDKPTILGIIEPARVTGEFKETGHGTVVQFKKSNSTKLPSAA